MLENTQYGFSKDKLPKAFSYPLKRSLLDAGLNGATAMDAVLPSSIPLRSRKRTGDH